MLVIILLLALLRTGAIVRQKTCSLTRIALNRKRIVARRQPAEAR